LGRGTRQTRKLNPIHGSSYALIHHITGCQSGTIPPCIDTNGAGVVSKHISTDDEFPLVKRVAMKKA
jgi:hypothetical protein